MGFPPRNQIFSPTWMGFISFMSFILLFPLKSTLNWIYTAELFLNFSNKWPNMEMGEWLTVKIHCLWGSFPVGLHHSESRRILYWGWNRSSLPCPCLIIDEVCLDFPLSCFFLLPIRRWRLWRLWFDWIKHVATRKKSSWHLMKNLPVRTWVWSVW